MIEESLWYSERTPHIPPFCYGCHVGVANRERAPPQCVLSKCNKNVASNTPFPNRLPKCIVWCVSGAAKHRIFFP